MQARTLFQRLFDFVPGHFKRNLQRTHYFEEFRLGNKILGEFYFIACDTSRSSTIILRPVHQKFFFKENWKQTHSFNGCFIEQELFSISSNHKCQLEFEGLGQEIINLLDSKKDSDIVACSCCFRKF